MTTNVRTTIDAVLLDVDGTLYHAHALRVRVALALLAWSLRHPARARRTWKQISAFRRALEELRHAPRSDAPLRRRHLDRAAEIAGTDAGELEAVVEEWMMRRPLAYLRRCRRPGAREFLASLRKRGLPVGLLSDYPVEDKADALGLRDHVTLCICATDPEVNVHKPWPDGFRRACEIWEVPPDRVLYVGDRPEVDAVGAAAAGMRCAILRSGYRGRPATGEDFLRAGSFRELQSLLEGLA